MYYQISLFTYSFFFGHLLLFHFHFKSSRWTYHIYPSFISLHLAFNKTKFYLSHSNTWIFWDVATGQKLYEQEGHSDAVYSIAFQCDGSLCATCGMDKAVKLWDLRSGCYITTFTGHVDDVLSVDFSPNGYEVASGGSDNTVRVWDLRRRRCAAVIPGHNGVVSKVLYEVCSFSSFHHHHHLPLPFLSLFLLFLLLFFFLLMFCLLI